MWCLRAASQGLAGLAVEIVAVFDLGSFGQNARLDEPGKVSRPAH